MNFGAICDNWNGDIFVNDKLVSDLNGLDFSNPLTIKLVPKSFSKKSTMPTKTADFEVGHSYRITVKAYMTKPTIDGSTFDFMEKYNANIPMPLRVMTGEVLKVTNGMVKMRLHGDIWAKKICTCMACGRVLTNPISQYFGIGPECSGNGYALPNGYTSEEALKAEVDRYRKVLLNTVWEGWVIKSAITDYIETEN